jgi:hypothetical protein
MSNDPLRKPTADELSPSAIVQLGLGFWGAKVLHGAVELDVFSELAKGPADAESLRMRLGLHSRSTRDFLDALVSLGMLERKGDRYANTAETDLFLDRAKPTYIGGILEMASARLYPFWGNLTAALRSGLPQNEIAHGGEFFSTLYSDPARLKQFLQAMTGVSLSAARAIAAKFPWQNHQTMFDVGGAQGCVPAQVALRHLHVTGGVFDLPPVGPVFQEHIDRLGLQDRLRFVPGNFFEDPLPSADVLIMGHILHDWNLDEKKQLLAKAYAALPHGGALIVYEGIIDDDRRENTFGLLMSLNMLIETEGGFDYSGADCSGWMKEVGFRKTYVQHLDGPDSMVVGIK